MRSVRWVIYVWPVENSPALQDVIHGIIVVAWASILVTFASTLQRYTSAQFVKYQGSVQRCASYLFMCLTDVLLP